MKVRLFVLASALAANRGFQMAAVLALTLGMALVTRRIPGTMCPPSGGGCTVGG